MTKKAPVLLRIRRLIDRVRGESPHSEIAVLRLQRKSGREFARIEVFYDDPDEAMEALATVAQPQWLLSIAREIGVQGLPEPVEEDDEDSEDFYTANLDGRRN